MIKTKEGALMAAIFGSYEGDEFENAHMCFTWGELPKVGEKNYKCTVLYREEGDDGKSHLKTKEIEIKEIEELKNLSSDVVRVKYFYDEYFIKATKISPSWTHFVLMPKPPELGEKLGKVAEIECDFPFPISIGEWKDTGEKIKDVEYVGFYAIVETDKNQTYVCFPLYA